MVNKLIAESASGAVTGIYDYGLSRLWLPQEATITAAPITSGEARYIANSGVIAIYNGIDWTIFTLRDAGLPPDDPSISGQMASWADPTIGSKITPAGSGVETWTTIVPGSHSWVDTGAAVTPSVASGVQNGLEAVYFDGTANFSASTSFYNLFSGDDKPCTMFAVVRNDRLDASANSSIVSLGKQDDDTPLFAMEFGLSSFDDILIGRRADDGGNAFGVRGGSGQSGLWTVVAVRFDGTTCEVYQDGVTVFTAASGMNVNTMSINAMTMGAFERTSVADFWTGFIGEVIMYTSGLPVSAMSGVSTWLQSRWAI